MASNPYTDPLGFKATPERIDQGVDYSGSGPLLAVGSGVITNISPNGWPGTAFIGLKLDSGQYAGDYVYYAEDIAPAVSVGQRVKAGQLIGHATGGSSGIELGWAASPASGQTMADLTGQNKAGLARGDPGAFPTAYGVSYSNFISSLGAPPGVLSGQIQGTVTGNFPGGSGATPGGSPGGPSATDFLTNPVGAVQQEVGNILGSVTGPVISGLVSSFKTWIEGIFGVASVKDLMVRIGLLLLGITLLFMGLHAAFGSSSQETVGGLLETSGIAGGNEVAEDVGKDVRHRGFGYAAARESGRRREEREELKAKGASDLKTAQKAQPKPTHSGRKTGSIPASRHEADTPLSPLDEPLDIPPY